MSKALNGTKFQGHQNGIMQLTAVIGTGSAKVQALAGGKDGTLVDFADNELTASGLLTFYITTNQWYQVVLTGDAQAWLAG